MTLAIQADVPDSHKFGTDHKAEHLVDSLEHALTSADDVTAPIRRADAPAELTGAANLNTLLKYTAQDWGWILLCWLCMSYAPAWSYPVWALLIAGRLHALGVILHDLTHMPLRGKTWRVHLIEVFAGYPIASTLNAMRFHHLRHHRDSGMPTDPYYKMGVKQSHLSNILLTLRGVILVPFWIVRGFVGVMSLWFPALRNTYAHVFMQDRSHDDLTHTREVIQCARAEIGQVCFHLALLVATFYYAEYVLYYYAIPVTLAGLLNAYRALMEHNYAVARDRRIETIIQTTVDHNLDPLGRVFLAPRNTGYHIVHHIHPAVALENLPALRDWYRNRYPDLYPPSRGLFVSGQ